MNIEQLQRQYRLLVIDDNRAIHEDFRKILAPDEDITQLNDIEEELFGKKIEISSRQDFEIDSAYQGKDGLALVEQALVEKRPYTLAFVDMRMPPGWNGIETIEHIWKADPDLQIVICSAYSDHSWLEISKRLGCNDQLLILKKPFDNVEILQMAYAMSCKCVLTRNKTKMALETPELELIDKTDPGDTNDKLNPELKNSLHEIKQNIQSLQQSYADMSKHLVSFRDIMAQADSGKLQKSLKQLLDMDEFAHFAELEAKIPNFFNRLESALKQVSDKAADKPIH